MRIELRTKKPGPVERRIAGRVYVFEKTDNYDGLTAELPEQLAVSLLNQAAPKANTFGKAKTAKKKAGK